MPLDRLYFKEEVDGGYINMIRDNENKRFNPSSLEKIDKIKKYIYDWRHIVFERSNLKAKMNNISKDIGKMLKKSKQIVDCVEREKIKSLKSDLKVMKSQKIDMDEQVKTINSKLDQLISEIGNILHEKVPLSPKNSENITLKEEKVSNINNSKNILNANQIRHKIDVKHLGFRQDNKKPYQLTFDSNNKYFIGDSVVLMQAIKMYTITYLMKAKFCMLQPPYFIKQSAMENVTNIKELYKLPSDENKEDKYLISSNKQAILSAFKNKWILEQELPKYFALNSTCFDRKSSQHIDRIDVCCIQNPDDSWTTFDNIVKLANEYFKSYNITYRVREVVSGNLAIHESKCIEIQAWFPSINDYKTLMTCSNSTDYETRATEIRCGSKKMGDRQKKYCHLISSNFCNVELLFCCILENYSSSNQISIPDVLKPYMLGINHIELRTLKKE